MSQRKYAPLKALELEIIKMREDGMCKRENAEHFNLTIGLKLQPLTDRLKTKALNIHPKHILRQLNPRALCHQCQRKVIPMTT